MSKYRKKSVIIDAFRIGIDYIPDWFMNKVSTNEIILHGKSSGLFIMMPNRRTPDGDFKDIVHPINQETRELIQSTILKKYEELERRIIK